MNSITLLFAISNLSLILQFDKNVLIMLFVSDDFPQLIVIFQIEMDCFHVQKLLHFGDYGGIDTIGAPSTIFIETIDQISFESVIKNKGVLDLMLIWEDFEAVFGEQIFFLLVLKKRIFGVLLRIW